MSPPLVFRSLSDRTRLRLLNLLLEGEVCVCELGEILGLEQPTVSRHLAYLKRAGLVESRREARWMHYRWKNHAASPLAAVLGEVRAWLEADPGLIRERKKLRKIQCRQPSQGA